MLRIKAFYFLNNKIAFAAVVSVIVTNTYPSFNISLTFFSTFWTYSLLSVNTKSQLLYTVLLPPKV